MKPIATTKMSSKGQVVIPEGIRQQLGIDSGTQFVVVGQKDVIILKTIAAPAMHEFDGLIRACCVRFKFNIYNTIHLDYSMTSERES